MRNDRVAKRIDRFLVVESLLDLPVQFRKWVDSGGESDHMPIILEIVGGPKNPTSPYKFNPTWIEDDSFKALVSENWIPYDVSSGTSASIQFVENLKRIK
jgi:hypothetical protein